MESETKSTFVPLSEVFPLGGIRAHARLGNLEAVQGRYYFYTA